MCVCVCVCVCVSRYHIFFIDSSINGQLGAVCLVTQSCPCQSVFATPWTIAHQSPLSMGFSRQEYWRGLSCPPPGESSQPRDGTQDSCIAGGFFTVQTAREALTTAEMLNLESPWLWLTRRVLLLSSPAAPAGRASGLQQGHCVWT